ncbi:twin-arginine translocation signal domain-containing protein [Helicobacter sp. MIT 14-3879]|uniref:twin-arginine translocation signal domain-containing protein n=1 Tax=Helicobacter sp. MIT 14-3879 TaxID=2040649 RepID=UPI000E1F9E19|nr:twin-arginine translocation signal domain-containing protein [Helicobacter sp. MIT 14-3879]RDU64859.1 hypothetical protein CQA44_03895 [Helicobacter sp. MIT 14-3879]
MNPRRKFLKTTAKAGAITAVAGIAISACSSNKSSTKITRGKSKKEEVLYQKSPYWEAYYKVAH